MKTHRLHLFAFIMFIGMIMILSSCNKNNDTPNLIGTWCVEFGDIGKKYDLTFNTDGRGAVKVQVTGPDDGYSYSEPFSYIFNGEESSVTIINNYSYAVIEIMNIWGEYYPGYDGKDPQGYACSFKVQIRGGILELTDSNNLTVPFTRQ